MLTNVNIEEARAMILGREVSLRTEYLPIIDSLGYVLAEDIESDINLPPFDRSPLDGYALRSEDIRAASRKEPVELEVIDNIQAGYLSQKTIKKGQAIRIMTGAKIPQGADIIIRYEDTDFTEEKVKIYSYLKTGSNIVPEGEDIKKGDRVLKKGKEISPADLGILASLGREEVRVYGRPRIGILATGDELIEVGQLPQEGKIRNSNSYSLAGQIRKIGGEARLLGICNDEIPSLKERLLEALEWADIVISTGGVSVGDKDVVKEVFQEMGGEILFWRVNMKPGTPIVVASYKDKLLFGLSGNPAAAYITFEIFVRPFILKMQGKTGLEFAKVKSRLTSEFSKVSKQNRYVRGFTYYENGGFYTRLPEKHGSGVLSSLSKANSLFLIPSGQGPYKSGEEIEVELLDWPGGQL